MATSVVPTVMSTLRTRLRARVGLAGVQILSGWPWQPDRDFVAIMDADPHEQTPAGMRTAVTQGRLEEFELEVALSALRSGDEDHTQAVDRVYVLTAELENDLLGDATIGGSLGTTGYAHVVGLPLTKLGPNKDGAREARVTARVRCVAID